jgi:hypothetical protein
MVLVTKQRVLVLHTSTGINAPYGEAVVERRDCRFEDLE